MNFLWNVFHFFGIDEKFHVIFVVPPVRVFHLKSIGQWCNHNYCTNFIYVFSNILCIWTIKLVFSLGLSLPWLSSYSMQSSKSAWCCPWRDANCCFSIAVKPRQEGYSVIYHWCPYSMTIIIWAWIDIYQNRQSLCSSIVFVSIFAIGRSQTIEEIADTGVLNAILNQLWWALVQLEQK